MLLYSLTHVVNHTYRHLNKHEISINIYKIYIYIFSYIKTLLKTTYFRSLKMSCEFIYWSELKFPKLPPPLLWNLAHERHLFCLLMLGYKSSWVSTSFTQADKYSGLLSYLFTFILPTNFPGTNSTIFLPSEKIWQNVQHLRYNPEDSG